MFPNDEAGHEFEYDLTDVDLADRPMPSVPRMTPSRRALLNAAFEIATIIVIFALAVLVVGAVRGDQDVTVKPGRLKKLETKLTGKKIIWRAVGDFDLIEDTSGKSAIFLAPTPGKYSIFAATAKGDEPAVEVITVTVEGDVPVPPGPGPGPVPPIPPDPKPAPIKYSDVVLVVVEETANASAERGQWITSKAYADLFNTPGFKIRARIVDQDVKDASGQTPANLAPYITRAKTAGIPQWFLVSTAGDLLGSGPMPKTPAELADTIRKKAGW